MNADKALGFLVRRGGYWLLQWWRLGAALVGIATFGLVDGSLAGERIYLDACYKILHKDKLHDH